MEEFGGIRGAKMEEFCGTRGQIIKFLKRSWGWGLIVPLPNPPTVIFAPTVLIQGGARIKKLGERQFDFASLH